MADTRLTLRQAAAVLGVSESAIRKRVERGTLRSDKGPDGRRYVYLDTVADNVADDGADTSAPHERDALISELRAHNGTLREQLEAERQAHAEARRLLAAALERIPAIEAPADSAPEQPGAPKTARSVGEKDQPSQVEDPGPAQWTMLLLSLSAIGVGSAPLFSYLANGPLALGIVSIALPYALFVLPFIFGLYRGVWTKRKTEFIELAKQHSDRQENERSPGAESTSTGGLETIYAFALATGAALVAVAELSVVIILIFGNYLYDSDVLRQIFLPAIFVFIGTFLFFVFAELIGVAVGGRQDRRDISRTDARGGRLAQASWWNPQLIFGLVGTIITTVGAVIVAAMAGGG